MGHAEPDSVSSILGVVTNHFLIDMTVTEVHVTPDSIDVIEFHYFMHICITILFVVCNEGIALLSHEDSQCAITEVQITIRIVARQTGYELPWTISAMVQCNRVATHITHPKTITILTYIR